jgi:hypothetical protein
LSIAPQRCPSRSNPCVTRHQELTPSRDEELSPWSALLPGVETKQHLGQTCGVGKENECPLPSSPACLDSCSLVWGSRRSPAAAALLVDRRILGLRGRSTWRVDDQPRMGRARREEPPLPVGCGRSDTPLGEGGDVRNGSGPPARRQPGDVSRGSASGPSRAGRRSAAYGHERTWTEPVRNPCCGKKATHFRVDHRLQSPSNPPQH